MTPAAAPKPEPEYVTPLQRILREDGIKQVWLARQIGAREDEVSRIVRGMVPDAHTKAAIARTLRREIDELWPPVRP